MSLTDIIMQQLANGLVLGSFYALVALGYTMVYGVIQLLNFAHGGLYMVGAFVGFWVLSLVGGVIGAGWGGIAVAMLISMVVVGCLGMVIERVAYRPMLKAPRLSILITALTVLLVLRNAMLAVTGGQYFPFIVDLGFAGINIGAAFVSYTKLVVIVVAVALMVALQLFVTKTRYGKAMRAIALDQDMCRLLGINVYRLIAITFFIGTALAAAGGVMAGVLYGSISYFMGFQIGLKAFTAAVIGGIGSIPGAMFGGLLLGLLEAFATQVPFIGAEWTEVFSFGILILVLVFKPTGIFGRSEVERM